MATLISACDSSTNCYYYFIILRNRTSHGWGDWASGMQVLTTYAFDFDSDSIPMICGDGMTKLPGIPYNETDWGLALQITPIEAQIIAQQKRKRIYTKWNSMFSFEKRIKWKSLTLNLNNNSLV